MPADFGATERQSSVLPTQVRSRDFLVAPSWQKTVLRAAGIYNLVWGLWAIAFPLSIFRLAGFEPLPAYPELWQCIGMIVGVYGIGYWIAASDPYRHWPIVLVGLLGKIFGPMGFTVAVTSGRFPATMGLTILTNDLIWWIPFAMILFGAARASQTRTMIESPETELANQHGTRFDDLVQTGRTLVVLLRHAGCTFCRETLSRVSSERSRVEDETTKLVFVHMGPEDDATRRFFEQYGLGDASRVSDPAGLLYERFGLGIATWQQMLGWKVWWRGFKAFAFGRHGVGKLAGNGFQMPGSVLIEDGQVVAVDRADDASHVPDLCGLNEQTLSAQGAV